MGGTWEQEDALEVDWDGEDVTRAWEVSWHLLLTFQTWRSSVWEPPALKSRG